LGALLVLLQKEQNQNQSQIKIKGYKSGQINISDDFYETPILLNAFELSLFESVQHYSDLTAALLLPFIPKGTEIILIGCGEKHQFFPQKEIKQINDLGIAVEVMGTRQACHTFQVLTYENREIIALLFP
jgi:uncharacterized protein